MGNIGLVEKVSDAAAVRKRVVDHARAGSDDAETYGMVGEINPAGTRERRARIGSRTGGG